MSVVTMKSYSSTEILLAIPMGSSKKNFIFCFFILYRMSAHKQQNDYFDCLFNQIRCLGLF